MQGLGPRLVAVPLLQAGVEDVATGGDAGGEITRLDGKPHGGAFRLGASDSEAGEEPPQLVEIDPPGLDGWGVGGIEAEAVSLAR